MFTWDPMLETGISEIDEQHRLLFRKADAVVDALEAGQGAHDVKRTIQFLADYAALHFETEERYMRAAGYPDADAHAEIHARITRRIMEVAADYHAQGASPSLQKDLDAMIRGWLTMHIAEKDRAVADWLKQSQSAPQG
ncbi:MAG: hemerythrin family protein [Anaeromyxobacter sp.]|nr:hemerythrin family protein [Anaeromyxobacter sp.]